MQKPPTLIKPLSYTTLRHAQFDIERKLNGESCAINELAYWKFEGIDYVLH